MSLVSRCLVSGSKRASFSNKAPAFPEIEVRGVRRSWEMLRRRSARTRSFSARIAADSFSRTFFSFSRASAHSPRMDCSVLCAEISGSGFRSVTQRTA